MTGVDEPALDRVTPAMREYVQVIGHLDDGSGPVTTQQIAVQIGVSCPSVTNTIKRLHESGLIRYERYHGVELTAAGRRIARIATRRRDVLERYLIEKLEYRLDEARIEASHLERVVTDALVAHLSAALERPIGSRALTMSRCAESSGQDPVDHEDSPPRTPAREREHPVDLPEGPLRSG
ncbi:MAG: metal-dependent transcriptional regulator [Chloroflexota bacterium]|nr:metal-dependent transcriptional regulator [Chloroflexota bacterium]